MLKTQPNTTEIPNVVIDYWLPKLPNATALILIYFCRKSYCVAMHNEVITLVQIQKQTGFSMAAVLKAIDHLVAHNLIKKYEPKFKGCRSSYLLTLDVVSVAEVVREEAMQEVIKEIKTESKKREVDLGYFYNYWLPRLNPGEAIVLLCVFRIAYAQSELYHIGLADLEIMTRYCRLSLKKYLSKLCLHGVVVRVDEINHQYRIREESMEEVIKEIKTESKKEVDLGYFYNYWLPRLNPGEAIVLLCVFRIAYAQSELYHIGLADLELMTRFCKPSLKKYLSKLCLHGVVVCVDEINHQYRIGKL